MCPQGYRDIDRMDDDEEEEEEEGEDPEDDPDVQDIRWFWCEDFLWTWAVLSASSQTGKISLGGGVRLIYPVTDSGLKVKGAHTLSLFPSGESGVSQNHMTMMGRYIITEKNFMVKQIS